MTRWSWYRAASTSSATMRRSGRRTHHCAASGSRPSSLIGMRSPIASSKHSSERRDTCPPSSVRSVGVSKREQRDAFFHTARVGSFAHNRLRLYDMIGNVWEWTNDWYDGGTLRVARGGSWFCSANYCGAYRAGYRGKSPPERAFNNVGFRCAGSVTARERTAV